MRSGFPNRTILLKREMLFLFLLLCIPLSLRATSLTEPDNEYNSHSITKKKNFFYRTADFINRILEQDTAYVAPNRFNLCVMPQYTFGYEYYRFSIPDKAQSIAISPAPNNKIGIYGGWRWIFFGYNFTLDKIKPEVDMELNLYCSRAGLELFYRKRSEGFKIRSLKGFHENNLPLKNYDRNIDGLSISQMGANAFYVFNYRKFSFPAAFVRSTNQRVNAGSVILGVSFHKQQFMFDHTKIDPTISKQILPELQFQNVNYMAACINLGYSFNWVFAKNFLANISATPAIGYKNTSLKFNNSKEFISSINIDLVSRLSLVYNNGKYYAGASLVSNTYSYTKSSLSIQNGFGYLKVYAGFKFWRRK
jgi:hypothetical protein